jgi:nickel/cobalt transporter (NicO) family protein
MPDWLITYLGAWQGGVMRTLATELRAGGLGSVALAFMLGALHALTPGHGKAALTAYFLGTASHVGKGIRIALSAAAIHVFSGLLAFLVLRFVLGQAPSITGRGSPTYSILGYTLVIVAGLTMLWQSWRPGHRHNDDGAHALTAGIGLLPCPLTISVLGFAWLQSSILMLVIVLLSLAAGIASTIGLVAVGAIAANKAFGASFATSLPQFEKGAVILQVCTGAVIVLVGAYMLWKSI